MRAAVDACDCCTRGVGWGGGGGGGGRGLWGTTTERESALNSKLWFTTSFLQTNTAIVDYVIGLGKLLPIIIVINLFIGGGGGGGGGGGVCVCGGGGGGGMCANGSKFVADNNYLKFILQFLYTTLAFPL